jgi:UDP-glucose 4-epimerase
MSITLVTGATGFVGRHLVQHLAAAGMPLRAQVRRPGSLPPAFDHTVTGDIGPGSNWSEALRGVTQVVHAAGVAHRRFEQREDAGTLFHMVNCEGTLTLAKAAASAGVRHFLFLSSIHVNGTRTDGRAPFLPDELPAPEGPYALSKAAAEERLEALARETGMAVTILRPVVMVGAGAKGNVAMLASAIRRGVPLPLAALSRKRAYLNVENLCSFILFRLGNAAMAGCTRFILADYPPVSVGELARALGAAMGRPARLFPVPDRLLGLGLKAVGKGTLVDGLMGELLVDSTKVQATGWRPPLTFHAGIQSAFGGGEA